ncbi:MAG: ABC transporter ATP-binding protein [Anaerolineaceae bacterium]|nr:MAG: ABC transporter ATP-binding protein [Anaerolineaceae bacterium]
MTTITLQNITRRFTDDSGQSVQAIDDLSLRVREGEVLALMGPSGCGKTTLLRLVAGLDQPDSGEILYDQTPMAERPMEERGIGMVFQHGALMPHWESERTIGFFLRLRQREHEVPERVRRISQITGIGMEALMTRRPNQLSGGERQRVAVARALARDLKLLLFDEPFSNLDAHLRGQARLELRRLLNEFPITALYVTHDQDEAVTLADRLVIMNHGRIEQAGSYRQLYDSPVNLFVAKFFGHPAMNFFEGEVRDGAWHGENFGGYPFRRDLPDGTPVTMGVRPQYFHLCDGGVAGVVDSVVPYLSERRNLVTVWLGGERWAMALPMGADTPRGATVYCCIEREFAHFFDAETGLRIG